MNLNLCWLYPQHMSTYGDRGNVICLQKRCQWRNIKVTLSSNLEKADLVFAGGAQDRQQSLIIADLNKKKSLLKNLFDRGIPGLFVCGSPQLLGHFYQTAEGKKLPGLGIFDFETRTGAGKPRLIGDLIVKTQWGIVVGFENHSGRTFLGNLSPFGTVLFGSGNNGLDKTEGAVYQNVLATYSHGPLLPKNPVLADWLVSKALEVKYGKALQLDPLDDSLEKLARQKILARHNLHESRNSR